MPSNVRRNFSFEFDSIVFNIFIYIVPSSCDGVVRVIGRRNQGRVLLRGMNGLVIDLAFAHTNNEVILASVDEYGNAFVHSIKDDGENLTYPFEFL